MPVKVKIQNLKQVTKSVKDNLKKVLRDTRMQKDLVELSQRVNKADVSLGKDPVTGKAFKSLSGITIAQRRYLAKFNQTSSQYRAGKSNLTFSGQLVRSIRSRAVVGNDELRILNFVLNARKGYKTGSGRTSKTPKNSQLVEYLKDMGRNTLGFFIDNKRRTQIKNIIRASLRRRLR